ncbi:GNAT family N-acetyltransferase [Streptomyces sp. Qhu-G9]|uniref:GNAT family N-acetyltransferase n=1 Tax=Streptomyces sp. Qhu-G9 TaxID=3452799 RepID=UPI0022AC8948|nr:GNAT family N-acetyltransferase [Streptomyces aurantiacus]WAU85004.1 GNAT family N-acetyltransferase [Streptomyces aurantiacus]
MDIAIRRAEPGEYTALGEITAQAYLGDGLLDFGESDEYLGELRNVAKRAAAADVLVAVESAGTSKSSKSSGGRVLGGVTFVPSGGLMAEISREGEAEIRMLAVSKEARGRGVGTSLVRACIDRARTTEGCWGIVLSTQRTMHSAHRIYERLGFTRAPGRDWNPVPQLDDIMLLSYELTL